MSNYSNRRGNRARYRRRRRGRNRINYKPIIKIGAAVLVVVLIIILMKSCGHKVGDIKLEAGQSAVYLEDDGSVTYGVAETFESEYLDESELENQIESEVDTFNANDASVSDAMDIDYFDVSSGVAKAIFTFETEKDFSTYMNQYNRENDFIEADEDGNKSYEFFLGNVGDYEGKIDATFTYPDKKDSVDISDLSGKMLVVSGNYKVQVEGLIVAMSDNCTAEDGIITTSKNERSYIIYTLDD